MQTVLLLAGILGLAGAVWFLLPAAARRLGEYRLRRICRDHRLIVLSYDDGPGATLTPRILDLLGARDAKATFFLLGRNAEPNAPIVARILAEGHDVGSHTFDHTNAWRAGPWSAAQDLEHGRRATGALGADTFFFRPPFGKLTFAGLVHGWWRGLRFGWWTADSKDTANTLPTDIDPLIDALRPSGGVVLLHDFDRIGPESSARTTYTLEATRRILDLAEAEEFRIVPLSHALSLTAR